MNLETFAHEIALVQHQVDKMQRQIKEGAFSPDDLAFVQDFADSITTALEKIAVAQEEVNLQSSQLEKAVEQLETEQRGYQQLFAPAPVAYLLTDINGVIQQANRAAAALLNVELTYLKGKPLFIFIPKNEHAAFFDHIARAQADDALQEWEMQFRPRHSSSIEVLVAISGAAAGDGQTMQWAFQNITERKRAQEKISQLHRELTALNIFSTVISSTLELSAIFTALKRLLSEQLTIPGGVILSVDDTGHPLRIEASWGLDEQEVSLVKSMTLINSDPKLTSVPDGVIFAEQRRNALLAALSCRASSDWRAGLSLEFVVDGEIRHIVDTFSPNADDFGSERVIFLETLAQEVAVAVRKVSLFARVRSLSHQIIQTQEKERRQLARELHDEIGQQLTGLKLLLEGPVSTTNTVDDKVRHATEAVNQLIGQVRTLSLNLRPAMLDDLGLLSSLLWYFQRYTEQSRICVNFQHSGLEGRLDPEVETAAYRIVQETLTNVARHAHVQEVEVRAWVNPNALFLHIRDDGYGFDLRHKQSNPKSSGLNNMVERATLLHGRLEIDTAPGIGTSVTVELPLI